MIHVRSVFCREIILFVIRRSTLNVKSTTVIRCVLICSTKIYSFSRHQLWVFLVTRGLLLDGSKGLLRKTSSLSTTVFPVSTLYYGYSYNNSKLTQRIKVKTIILVPQYESIFVDFLNCRSFYFIIHVSVVRAYRVTYENVSITNCI